MESSTSPMVFQFVGESVENAIAAFLTPATSNLIVSIQILALTGVTLYILLTGYAIATGAVESPFWTFVKQSVKMMIIAVFALNADEYSNSIMSAFDGLETGLTEAIASNGNANGQTIYQVLDQSLGNGMTKASTCFKIADDASFGAALSWNIVGGCIIFGTAIVSLIGAANIIVAKFSLAVVFAIGPIFVLSLMFPVTAKFFDSWFSQTMNYVLTIVIMAVVMTFSTEIFNSFLAKTDVTGSGEYHPMFAAAEILVVVGVLVWIILQTGHVASGLAGGLSMAAMGIRHLMTPINTAKKAMDIANPMTTKRDMQSGMLVTARRSSHIMYGNTMLNPAYRQHVMENLGKNWKSASGGKVKSD